MASTPFPMEEEQADDKQMDDNELVSILAAHAMQAVGYQPGGNDDITAEQERALNYYNRIMDDLPAQEGCSSVIDGTVALVVDNALSAVLRPFVSSEETVRFVPRQEEDIPFAEQATEYVNYIFNVDNNGFLILHDWFKDALLTKLGVVKVWWEDQSHVKRDTVPIESDIHAALLRMAPSYAGEDEGNSYHDTPVSDGRVKLQNVPPEEFRVTPQTRDIENAIYSAHVPTNTIRSDLIDMGFDPEIVESLPAWTGQEDSTLAMARYQDEGFDNQRPASAHSSQDRIALRDEYIRVDYDGDGIAELRRVMRVDDTILLNEECDEAPFATICPIPMPHKLFGLSLADICIQEQRISTALWRQMLDNLYKSNNPRPVVGEGAERRDGSTTESLNDNAPGAAVLVSDAAQMRFDAVPYTAGSSLPMLEMIGQMVENRTGVGQAGQGLDTNALRKSGQMTATEMAMISGGKNARIEMIARIFAETGVRRVFKLILGLVCKHQDQARVIRLRNKWAPMDPKGWPEMDVSISVGLGIGDKSEQIMVADGVLQTMEQLGATPFAALINMEKVYNAVKRKFTAAGIKDIDEYLVEPNEAQQAMQQQPPQQSPEAQKAMAQIALMQAKQQTDQQVAQAKMGMANQQMMQDAQLNQATAQFEAQIAAMKQAHAQNLAEVKTASEAQLAQQKMDTEAQLNLHQQRLEAALTMHKQELEHKLKADHAERMANLKDQNLPTNRPGGDLSK